MSDDLPRSIRIRRRAARRVHAGALSLSVACAASVWSADDASDCLYRPFDIPAGATSLPQVVELTGRDWRLGAPQGAPVDEADMKRHLADAGRVLIGGVCAGTREEDTYRACGFALSVPTLAGRRYDDPRLPWQSTTGTALVSVADTGHAVISAFSVPEPVSVDVAPEGFVGLRAPAVLVRALRRAYGQTLSFGLHVVPNPLVAPAGGTRDGLVVLCADRASSFAAWRTSTPWSSADAAGATRHFRSRQERDSTTSPNR